MNSHELKFRAAGLAGGAVLSMLGRTLRLELEGEDHWRSFHEEGRGVIFALWHSRLLPLVYVHRGRGIVALVSEHRDGEYIARILARLGLDAARGSSTRGGTRGLRELLRVARDGRDLAITPDGPRGPARVLSPGVVTLARMTGMPVIPTAAGGDRVWRASSWDRFVIPKPFARLRVVYGPPLEVPREIAETEVESWRRTLEEALNRVTDEADGRSVQEPVP